ncbi:MAG: hypothetical protein JWR69_61 [Pedosphaera sp.]|nr:hypothetical protein [Pedosphaera sp.]
MAWSVPIYSKSQVDKAGMALLDGGGTTTVEARQIVDNWRSAHNFPLNSFQTGLRSKAKAVDGDFIVAQRIKRMSSILTKLKRYNVRLSQMQDIGGCRAIMQNITHVSQLVESYQAGDMDKPDHEKGKITDYIARPKSSGYRGVHIVYKYSGRSPAFHGLNIEIQIRTVSQHAWATAVETVEIFTKYALKSSEGSTNWLRFFAVMATVIAQMENCNPVPSTPTLENAKQLIYDYDNTLDALNLLKTYGAVISNIRNFQYSSDRYFLLLLQPGSKELEVRGYAKGSLKKASRDYEALENEIRGSGDIAVLVSANSIAELRKAFPNYFGDTTMFIDLVNQALA